MESAEVRSRGGVAGVSEVAGAVPEPLSGTVIAWEIGRSRFAAALTIAGCNGSHTDMLAAVADAVHCFQAAVREEVRAVLESANADTPITESGFYRDLHDDAQAALEALGVLPTATTSKALVDGIAVLVAQRDEARRLHEAMRRQRDAVFANLKEADDAFRGMAEHAAGLKDQRDEARAERDALLSRLSALPGARGAQAVAWRWRQRTRMADGPGVWSGWGYDDHGPPRLTCADDPMFDCEIQALGVIGATPESAVEPALPQPAGAPSDGLREWLKSRERFCRDEGRRTASVSCREALSERWFARAEEARFILADLERLSASSGERYLMYVSNDSGLEDLRGAASSAVLWHPRHPLTDGGHTRVEVRVLPPESGEGR